MLIISTDPNTPTIHLKILDPPLFNTRVPPQADTLTHPPRDADIMVVAMVHPQGLTRSSGSGSLQSTSIILARSVRRSSRAL
jgi:hypothetical protein